MSGLGNSNLGRGQGSEICSTSSSSAAGKSSGKKKDARGLQKVPVPESYPSSWGDHGGSGDSRLRNQIGNADLTSGQLGNSWNHSEGIKSSAACTIEAESAYDACETPKESESPRFKAIMQATSAPRKKFPADIKSFSHELNSKGVRPFPFWKPRGLYNSKEVLKVIQVKFEKAKEEVNSDLAVFAGDLVGIMEKHAESHPEWKETLEDLLLLARSCDVMTPGEFWLQCEGIVQDLDDRRQELPMGVLKKLHTRMLFILTRCTRLLQFHKESGFAEDEPAMDLRELHSADKSVLSGPGKAGKGPMVTRSFMEAAVSRKSYSQEQHNLKWKRSQEIKPVNFFSQLNNETAKEEESTANRERIASWKPLPSPGQKNQKEGSPMKDGLSNRKEDASQRLNRRGNFDVDQIVTNPPELPGSGDSDIQASDVSKHQHKLSWGNWDQQNLSDEGSIMCRICEEYVPTLYVEDHSRVCAVADRCDQKGLSVDERLIRIAETLEKMIEVCAQKDIPNAAGSPDITKISHSSVTEDSDVISTKLGDLSRRESADMLDCFQEADTIFDDMKNLPPMTCKTRFGSKSDQGMATSSAGSMTPRSPLMTPRTSHIDMLLTGKGALSETEDLPQIEELADIARCIANAALDDERSLSYLVSCVEDLQEVISHRKLEALTVQTFGTRIEKLHREKYLQLCDTVDIEKVDATSTVMDEEEDVVRSLRTSPIHPINKDRTSIDDFEIIKPISRGAFGRVFLAKKRTTGDLFAIKIEELADIARCIANAALDDERSLSYLVSCVEDLQEVISHRKLEALTVQTFGTRIEKLHREKYLQLCDTVDIEKVDATSTVMDEEEDVVRSLRTSPIHPINKDRTSIDDFEIIKPISRGAFGRVFLAKKRTTGDLFAIKVLKKADMIRKNAVESILAERDILISVRNPFVVRFFYSFTSRENLYLVMEYLNGGDLYSLLRNLGCLDEDVARVYIAEVLTDFGLSKVGLINSTDDLSGPAVSGTSLLGEEETHVTVSEQLNQRDRRKKRSAVGTPDYLAPEILLGTGHGASADWWSVGVILFELIVGIPPFNAEHPQTIFDNILNRKIPWPQVPEEMSYEAYDLIDKLLTEDPNQRLGARGAPEVKQHVFFKNINWDTLARQKAAFVPSSENAHDTSYFTSRYSWNPSDEYINEASEYEDSSDNGSMSGGSSYESNRHDELGEESGGLTEVESESSVNYSFSNFSFKNLSQLASINYDLLTKGWKEEVQSKPNS
ncbi:uncharacterized protein A4U43_C03F15510 [Asparagus officinalis]|uniref:non-specific serine/threonine protein kinase n=1 Tax=Asparagus officinalis TaxID=4686 RepID=A0A5P1FEJ5_ASPOF|nr:uncharacterized protein A4U43_C03F15510 [Asparagus officinalis]